MVLLGCVVSESKKRQVLGNNFGCVLSKLSNS